MQGIFLSTTFSPSLSITGIEVAKTNTRFLEVMSRISNNDSFITIVTCDIGIFYL